MSEDMHVFGSIAKQLHKANFTDQALPSGVKDAHHKSKEGGALI